VAQAVAKRPSVPLPEPGINPVDALHELANHVDTVTAIDLLSKIEAGLYPISQVHTFRKSVRKFALFPMRFLPFSFVRVNFI
jgi:hypothetical protein